MTDQIQTTPSLLDPTQVVSSPQDPSVQSDQGQPPVVQAAPVVAAPVVSQSSDIPQDLIQQQGVPSDALPSDQMPVVPTTVGSLQTVGVDPESPAAAPELSVQPVDPQVEAVVSEALAIQEQFAADPTQGLALPLPEEQLQHISVATDVDDQPMVESFPTNDTLTEASQPSADAMTASGIQEGVDADTDGQSQKSPLDILEEILNSSKKDDAEAGAQEYGPTPEEIEAQRLAQEAEQQALIEEKRQHLQAELATQEQQQRDALRLEQQQQLEQQPGQDIYQITRKKITL